MSNTREPLTVFIVDDDPAIRDSLALMLGLVGYQTKCFADAEAFLESFHPEWAGCVVADIRMPGISGIGLQMQLRERGSTIPFVIITAHGDVPTARTAFRAQVVDFLEKPFDDSQLLTAIETAFAMQLRHIQSAEAHKSDLERMATLTLREREVLAHAAKGLHAKEIGATLGISPRTVEVHKTRIMAKLGVRNVAELVRFAMATEQHKQNP